MKKETKEKISKATRGSKSPHYTGGSKSTDALNARRAWEKHWGKKVPKGYMVHHKDGNAQNQHISNLGLAKLGAHNKEHKKGKTLKEQTKGVTNKPNKGSKDGVQRRYR
jgi:hypothetical protein